MPLDHPRGTTHLIAATITRTPELSVTRRDTLFADPYKRNPSHTNYDVLPGGEFLMIESVGSFRLFATVNWFEELRRRTQAAAR